MDSAFSVAIFTDFEIREENFEKAATFVTEVGSL